MKSIETAFLDMFLDTCGPGRHEFTVVFGDERKQVSTFLRVSSTEWPFTFMSESFPQVWRMLAAWLVGGSALVTVRSQPESETGREFYPVEEVRSWWLSPLGFVPYAGFETSEAFGMAGDLTVWNMDRNREERFMDAWDDGFLFSVDV